MATTTVERPKRVLIVDDETRVHEYAARAFREFQRWHAYNPDEARRTIVEEKAKLADGGGPFDIFSCDINMPRYHPTGVELMKWIHENFPNIPIICHSDDYVSVMDVRFVKFVDKRIYDKCDALFNANEARLRAAALDLLFGKVSFAGQIKKAKDAGARRTLDGLGLSEALEERITATRRSILFVDDVFTFARGGYIDESTLVEILRFIIGGRYGDRIFDMLRIS